MNILVCAPHPFPCKQIKPCNLHPREHTRETFHSTCKCTIAQVDQEGPERGGTPFPFSPGEFYKILFFF